MTLLTTLLVATFLVDVVLAAAYAKTSRLLLAVLTWTLWFIALGTTLVRALGAVADQVPASHVLVQLHLAAIGAAGLSYACGALLGAALRPMVMTLTARARQRGPGIRRPAGEPSSLRHGLLVADLPDSSELDLPNGRPAHPPPLLPKRIRPTHPTQKRVHA